MGLLRRRRSPEAMKRLYDWLHRYYGNVERTLDPRFDAVLQAQLPTLGDTSAMTALDYACGSGLWTLKIAPHFQAVTGRDQSVGMLSRARERARQAGLTVTWSEGSILAVDEEDDAVDWVFVSFALHLFAPSTGVDILKQLYRVARRGVMIVDHSRSWALGVAIAEWLEGSHYDQFVRTDFAAVAREIGASAFDETTIADCLVLTFRKAAGSRSGGGAP